ncbi:MAG: hypothetical protein ACR2IE_01525 [Candidatus Sumerlaeaceae bacterium]
MNSYVLVVVILFPVHLCIAQVSANDVAAKYSLTSHSIYQDYKHAWKSALYDELTTDALASLGMYVRAHLKPNELLLLNAEASLHYGTFAYRLAAIQSIRRSLDGGTTLTTDESAVVTNSIVEELITMKLQLVEKRKSNQALYEQFDFIKAAEYIMLRLGDCRVLDLISCDNSALHKLSQGDTAIVNAESACDKAQNNKRSNSDPIAIRYYDIACKCFSSNYSTSGSMFLGVREILKARESK